MIFLRFLNVFFANGVLPSKQRLALLFESVIKTFVSQCAFSSLVYAHCSSIHSLVTMQSVVAVVISILCFDTVGWATDCASRLKNLDQYSTEKLVQRTLGDLGVIWRKDGPVK